MTRRLFYPLALLALPSVVAAQTSPQAAYDSAYFAWDSGDYPDALAAFARLLESPGGDRYLADIALVTGELYLTAEIAPDGRNPQWSADGRLAAYETPSGTSVRTHVISLDGGQINEIAVLEGTRAVFSPDAREIAYLVLDEGPELERTRVFKINNISF